MISRALLRFFVRSPWSTAVALVGVALGVVSIVSIHLVSVQIGNRLAAVNEFQFGGLTHFLYREDLTAQDYFALRKTWLRSGSDETRIRALAPYVDEEVGIDGVRVRVVGVDLFAQGATGAGDAMRSGVAFTWRGVWSSQSVPAAIDDYPRNGSIESPFPLVVADIGIALEILDKPADYLSYVGVEVKDGMAGVKEIVEKLLPGASAGLPQSAPGLALEDWRITTLDDLQPTNRFGQSILFNVSALATLAILVSWFLIYQVAVTWLRRLQGLFTRLHMLGVGQVAIVLRFLAALALLGVVASVPGVLAGRELAIWLLGSIGDTPQDVALDGWVVAKGFFSAVGVFVAGGLLAFRQADEVRWSKALVPIVVLLALCVLGVVWDGSGLAGAFLSIGALSFLATLTMRPLLQKLRLLSRFFRGGLLWRLSARELFWYPRDLAVALGGLVLAVATAMGVGLMVDSFRSDFSEMLERRLTYDIVVSGRGDDLEAVAAFAEQSAPVARVQRYFDTELRISGVSVERTAATVDEFEARRYGYAGELPSGAMLVSEQLLGAFAARGVDAGVGQTLGEYRVAGVFRSFGDLRPRVIVGYDNQPSVPSGVSLLLRDGARGDDFLRSLQQQFPAVRFTRSADLRETALATFDQTFAITAVLITIALIVAGIGIFIANQALRLNKLASVQMLDMMGATRGESWLMDAARSLTMGITAVVLAIPMGLAFGWILCNVVNPRAFGWSIELGINAEAILQPAMWGVLAALLAGVLRLGVGEETRFSDARA